ncbi:MAG: transglycosylase SLT domain-containing protein [Thermomicrobiales bacterium]
MRSPHPRGSRRITFALFALTLVVSGMSASLLPVLPQVALAKNAEALGETLILAGPGGEYGILTVAPAGVSVSVDGDAVDGYYPVSYEGVSGWAPVGLLDFKGDGNGGGGGGKGDNGGHDGNGGGGTSASGNGGVETVTADPVNSAPSDSGETPVTGGSYGPGGSGYSEDQIVDIIHEAANNYGQSPDAMVRVARCESGLDPNAVGGGGTYFGLFQFVPDTFARTPYGDYDIYDPWANANAAAWMWSEGRKGEWVCQ